MEFGKRHRKRGVEKGGNGAKGRTLLEVQGNHVEMAIVEMVPKKQPFCDIAI